MKTVAIYIGTLPIEEKEWQVGERLKYALVAQLLSLFKALKFALITDEPIDDLFIDYKNVKKYSLGKRPGQTLSLQHFYNYKMRNLLKKIDSDWFLSLEGILPKKYNGKATLLISDRITNEEKKIPAFERFQRHQLSVISEQVEDFLVLNEFTQKHLISTYKIVRNKIRVASSVRNKIFKPLEWEVREEVKEKYASGKEYILYMGDFSNKQTIMTLLKAFSLLKKKMNSGMVLVLAGNKETAFRKFSELIRTFHFNKDVRLTGKISSEETAQLMGAAYVGVVPTSAVGFDSPVSEMFQCHTPVIVPKDSIHETIGKEMVLGFKEGDFNDLGTKFCDLYRDEELRSKLIRQAEIETTQTSETIEMSVFSDILKPLN